MRSLLNLNLSTPKAKDTLSLQDIRKSVYDTVKSFIIENQMAPDIIRVVLTCTYLQFGDIAKRAFYGSVDALRDISEESYRMYLPTLDVSLIVILDPLPDKGRMKVLTKCENRLIPNIIPDTESTSTNINYQSIEPYFNKERLHFIAREFNPETYEMIIRWQFNGKAQKSTVATFKVSISNSGIRFEENHASEYILSRNDEGITIYGSSMAEGHPMGGNQLHIDSVENTGPLLDIRYSFDKGIWEYRVCSDNTMIRGETCYASDNFKPLDDSLTITVEGVGLFLEPLGKPHVIRK